MNRTIKRALLCLSLLYCVQSMAQGKSAAGVLERLDRDNDGQLTRQEWKKKKIFSQVDSNGDAVISIAELKAWFGESDATAPASDGGRPDAVTVSAIRRGMQDSVADLRARGLFETGLRPVWPQGVECRDIDHWYAKDYTDVRPKESYHGGIDIPAPYDTPVLAAMAGEVVASFLGKKTPRGIEVVLRHTPEQSGLPYYIYTRYTHFRVMPELVIGQQINLGDVLGITGNTGYQQCEAFPRGCKQARRSVLHFDVLYSESDKYFKNDRIVIPFDAYWMDPNALFRKQLPLDSVSMKGLPDEQKRVPISYQLESGERYPADTRMIWPYACRRFDLI